MVQRGTGRACDACHDKEGVQAGSVWLLKRGIICICSVHTVSIRRSMNFNLKENGRFAGVACDVAMGQHVFGRLRFFVAIPVVKDDVEIARAWVGAVGSLR